MTDRPIPDDNPHRDGEPNGNRDGELIPPQDDAVPEREPTSRRAIVGAAFGASLIWAPEALAKASDKRGGEVTERQVRAIVRDELHRLGLLKRSKMGRPGAARSCRTDGSSRAVGHDRADRA